MKQHHILYRSIDLSGSPANAWFPVPTSWKGCREWFLRILPVAWICSLIVISGCTPEQHKLTQQEKKSTPTYSARTEVGEASWYGPGFQGKKTANGEIFDQTKMTAAHPSLPMGTEVRVTNLDNNETVKVRINDRGPYAKDRVIDVSRAAAKKLDMAKDGTAQVKIERKLTNKKDPTD